MTIPGTKRPKKFERPVVPWARQVDLPIDYDGLHLDRGYRADVVVADAVIVEIKSVDRFLPVHEAQLLTTCASAGTASAC